MAKNLLENCNSLNLIFIGRDEQKHNFTNLLKQNNKKRVYNIHGVGGVGKTKLLGEFREQIKNLQNNPTIYAYINLEQENLTPIESLVKLAIAFRSNYSKFTLPTFWVAYTIYFSKANPQLTLKNINESSFFNELQAITDLSSIVDGGIPNLLTKLYSYIDSKVESGDIRDIRDELEAFKKLEDKEQIISYLAYFLANDIDNYIKAYSYKQVVILLDAYENIWQNSQNTIDCINDSFIRYLLIQLESNYLCVISGKEKLIWQSNKCDYPPEAEYKDEPLNSFIEKEAFEYLQKANIKEQEIIEQITNNAQGLPLYLYLEALTYNHLEKPSIEAFKNSTKEEVLNRFLKHLNQEEKAALEYFAHANSLTKELAIAISKEFNLNLNTIEKVLNYSFFNKDNNNYKLHSLLKKHIIANNTQIFKEQIEKFLLNYYESTFKNLELKDFKNLNLEKIEHNFKEAFYYKEQLFNIEEVANWLNGYSSLFYKVGLYSILELQYLKVIRALRKKNINNELLGTAYNGLGDIYYIIRDYHMAEDCYLKASKIDKEILGNNHVYTSTTYYNLGRLYSSIEEYQKSEKFYLKNLKIDENLLGSQHKYIADTYDGLARLYCKQGEYHKADDFYLKALKIYNKLGLNNIETGVFYNSLGEFYRNQKMYQKAKKYNLKALKIYKKILGFRNIYTSVTFNNLAAIYTSEGEYEKAEKYYIKALEINKVLFKNNKNPCVYNNLGVLYDLRGEYKKAEEYYLKALEIVEKTLGYNHSYREITCNLLVRLYIKNGKLKNAKKYLVMLLKISKHKYTIGHPIINDIEDSLKIIDLKLNN